MISSQAINLNELSWYTSPCPASKEPYVFFWSARSTSRVKFGQSWRKFSSQTREISTPHCPQHAELGKSAGRFKTSLRLSVVCECCVCVCVFMSVCWVYVCEWCVLGVCVWVCVCGWRSRRSGRKEGRSGYRTKNKNPTRQCGRYIIPHNLSTKQELYDTRRTSGFQCCIRTGTQWRQLLFNAEVVWVKSNSPSLWPK